jgi:hypothetical protein
MYEGKLAMVLDAESYKRSLAAFGSSLGPVISSRACHADGFSEQELGNYPSLKGDKKPF